MDLLDLIRKQIDALPGGEHLRGLKSVLLHIETAYRHFARAQSDGDDSLFTDTIYRTNQAFEGSVKEAYRVLAGKDPSKTRPFEIEQYLERQNIFPDRVLKQFTTYRTEWRNKSAHDYVHSFDEAEAFLAIVSVSAFTKLLVDEIAERLSELAVKSDIAAHGTTLTNALSSSKPLVTQLASALANFPKYYKESAGSPPIESESQLMGALAGFLKSVLPHAQISTGRILRGPKSYYIDMIVESDEQMILLELKRGDSRSLVERGVAQLSDYLEAANARNGILFLYSEKTADYEVAIIQGITAKNEIHIIHPAGKLSGPGLFRI
jgi:hypothetical protein